MWQEATEILADWIEEFRLFCVSYWAEIYAIRSELSLGYFVTSLRKNIAYFLSRQSILAQIIWILLFLFFTIIVIVKIYIRLTKGVCSSKTRLDGKTALITGANNGIGLETARDLSARGARIILACRNMTKGITAAKDVIKSTGNTDLIVRNVDLSSMANVRQFAKEILDTEER